MIERKKVHLVCSSTDNYIKNMHPFLKSALEHLDNVYMFTINFDADQKLFEDLPNLHIINMSHEDNFGAPSGTHSIQHGSFMKYFEETMPESLDDLFVFSDADILIQRSFKAHELDRLSTLDEDSIMVGWNSGPNETLALEGSRLRPFIKFDALLSDWGLDIVENPCFNVGVSIATGHAWKRIYNRYMELWDKVCTTFAHRARQQWLISYVISDLGMDYMVMPYEIHTHQHYGLPEGTRIDARGYAFHKKRRIMFRHRF
jgi:hypothetical protein